MNMQSYDTAAVAASSSSTRIMQTSRYQNRRNQNLYKQSEPPAHDELGYGLELLVKAERDTNRKGTLLVMTEVVNLDINDSS